MLSIGCPPSCVRATLGTWRRLHQRLHTQMQTSRTGSSDCRYPEDQSVGYSSQGDFTLDFMPDSGRSRRRGLVGRRRCSGVALRRGGDDECQRLGREGGRADHHLRLVERIRHIPLMDEALRKSQTPA